MLISISDHMMAFIILVSQTVASGEGTRRISTISATRRIVMAVPRRPKENSAIKATESVE